MFSHAKLSNARSVVNTFLSSDTKWLEITSTAFLIVWTALMASPLDVLTTTHSYNILNFMGAGFIGGFGALISTISIYGLVNRYRKVRRLGLILSQFYWATIALCFLAANYESTGGWIYSMLTILCSLGYIHGKQDN